MLDVIQGMQPDLTNVPLIIRDADLYMDGSSFIQEGTWYAGEAVVTGQKEVILGTSIAQGHICPECRNNCSDTSFKMDWRKKGEHQDRELICFCHVHGQTDNQRGLFTSKGKTIKHKYEIVQLLESIWLPTKLAITLWPGHLKDKSPQTPGSTRADQRSCSWGTQTPDCLGTI